MSVLIFMLSLPLGWSDDPTELPVPSIEFVRPLLNSDSNADRVRLLFENALVFSTYLDILKTKDITAKEQERILGLLFDVKADRKTFLRPTVELLSNPSPKVRLAALKLLSEIGEPKNCAPVVVFLGVEDKETITQAAMTMAAIGDEKTVIAFNIYLANGHYSYLDKETPAIIRKYRNQLKERLAKEKQDAKPAK